MKFLFSIVVLTNLIACNHNNSTENPNTWTNNNQEIINTLLNKMYTQQNILSDTLIFSMEIVALNKKCDSLTKVDTERIAKSNSPSDKPILREGSEVSSLYEGVTEFKINKIIDEKERTKVYVTLSNKHFIAQKPWREKIIFIKENGLKIDNIYFDKNIYHLGSNEPNLKENLINFSKQTIK